jgi:hypothetical protein
MTRRHGYSPRAAPGRYTSTSKARSPSCACIGREAVLGRPAVHSELEFRYEALSVHLRAVDRPGAVLFLFRASCTSQRVELRKRLLNTRCDADHGFGANFDHEAGATSYDWKTFGKPGAYNPPIGTPCSVRSDGGRGIWRGGMRPFASGTRTRPVKGVVVGRPPPSYSPQPAVLAATG